MWHERAAAALPHAYPSNMPVAGAESPTTQPPSLSTIAVLTCNRPEALRRALDSYAAASPAAVLSVFDDSRSATTAAENQAVARDVSRELGVTVSYAGVAERIRLADALVATGLPPVPVRFALAIGNEPAVSVGANRNALLLGMAGRLAFCVDDDTICEAAASPAGGAGVRVRHATNDAVDPVAPCDLWTFADRAALKAAVPFAIVDPLVHHGRFLGRPVGECLTPADGPDSAPSGNRDAVSADVRTGVVAVTLNGCAGDCGWQTPAAYLLLTGASSDRLTASESHYRSASLMREVLRVVPSPTITDACPNLMAGFMGIDGRQLLPPFPPKGRGEDALFGILVGTVCPDARFAHLPWALLHSPMESRAFTSTDMARGAIGIDLLTVLASSVLAVSNRLAGTPADRLQALGTELETLGRMPSGAAARLVHQEVARTLKRRLTAIERAMGSGRDGPPSWVSDVRTVTRLASQLLRRERFWVPQEFLDGGPDEAVRRVLAYLREFGRVLQEWPAIAAANRAVRQSTSGLERIFENGRDVSA